MASTIVHISMSGDQIGGAMQKGNKSILTPEQVSQNLFARGLLPPEVREDILRVIEVTTMEIYGLVVAELSTTLVINPALFSCVFTFVSQFDINRPAISVLVETPDQEELYFDGTRYSENDEERCGALNALADDLSGPISDRLRQAYALNVNMTCRVVAVTAGESFRDSI